MATVLPDFSVTIAQRCCACVLNPTLALSPLGLPLLRWLCHGMEIWLVRELWHIVDECDLLSGEVIGDGPLIVLRPGGCLRLAMPDFGVLSRLYVNQKVPLNQLVGILHGKQDYPENMHVTSWDMPSLTLALRQAGLHRYQKI